MKDHEHDHHHEHQHHEYHHHHQHEHEHQHQHALDNVHDGITSHTHDGALVCSGKCSFTGDLGKAKECLKQEAGLLAGWVEENNGIIGHIKGLIEVHGPVYTISTTGGEITGKEMPAADLSVNLVAIVFNMDMEKMESRMVSLLDNMIKSGNS